MTVGAALQQGAEILDRDSVGAPRLTAEVLLMHALHRDRAWLYAHSSDELPERAWIHYGRYLNERLKRKPTQYITGIQEFFGREFQVNSHVLIPRPETEHVVEAALAYLRTKPSDRAILDVGTGSGAIAITVALESRLPVFASDISLAALSVARRNANRLNAGVKFFAGDFLESVRPGSIDLLLSNPPYIPSTESVQREVHDWEPHLALFSGATGLEAYERLISRAKAVLRPGGMLMLELGYKSCPAVRRILDQGWTNITVIQDLAGIERVLCATLK